MSEHNRFVPRSWYEESLRRIRELEDRMRELAPDDPLMHPMRIFGRDVNTYYPDPQPDLNTLHELALALDQLDNKFELAVRASGENDRRLLAVLNSVHELIDALGDAFDENEGRESKAIAQLQEALAAFDIELPICSSCGRKANPSYPDGEGGHVCHLCWQSGKGSEPYRRAVEKRSRND
jgi:hypothetical protein